MEMFFDNPDMLAVLQQMERILLEDLEERRKFETVLMERLSKIEEQLKPKAVIGKSLADVVVAQACENEEIEDTDQSPATGPVEVEKPSFISQTLYFSGPSGGKFLKGYETGSRDNSKSLYTLITQSADKAVFYPLTERLARFRNNVNSLLAPVCDIAGNIQECISIEVEEKDYGKLAWQDGNWVLTEKCKIICL